MRRCIFSERTPGQVGRTDTFREVSDTQHPNISADIEGVPIEGHGEHRMGQAVRSCKTSEERPNVTEGRQGDGGERRDRLSCV